MKQKKGITLIVLVITIIILLILAGVSINFMFENDGIIGKAQSAVEKYRNAQNEEQAQISKVTNEIGSYVDGNREMTNTEKMMKPNTWQENQEQSFGDNVYGKRFTGTVTNGDTQIPLITTNVKNTRIINYGGYMESDSGVWYGEISYAGQGGWRLVDNNNHTSIDIQPSGMNGTKYNIWVLYTIIN